MSAIIQATCCCETIGASSVRLCPEHHRYWKGDKELVSVSKVLKGTWPIKPDFSAAMPDVLEHARERGVRVDHYFSEYLREGRVRVDAGEWQEVLELLQKLIEWWRQKWTGQVQSQVILSDNEIAGTCDFIPGDCILDLKTTYEIEPTYPIQLGAYAQLYESTFGRPPQAVGIVHLTKRFKEPRFIQCDLDEVRNDWKTVRSMWALCKRRTGK